jgi:hypothetical protein
MTNILAGLTSGARTFLVGWAFPSAITVALFTFLVLPSIDHLPVLKDLADLSAGTRTLTLAATAIAIAIVLSALQTSLYRLLEGYYLWPQSLQDARRSSHIEKKHRLKEAADHTRGLDRARLLERYRRYPVEDDQVTPTRLGNAIRAFETYAYNRFRLDSQYLWYELTAVVDEHVRTTVDNARAAVDFFVSLVYLFATLGVVSISAAVFGRQDVVRLVAVGAIALGLTPVWYRLAVIAIDDWSASVQALVNVGRKPLAEALGLDLPSELSKERHMWRVVNQFVRTPFDPRIMEQFDKYRTKPPAVGSGTEAIRQTMIEALQGASKENSGRPGPAPGASTTSTETGAEPEGSEAPE